MKQLFERLTGQEMFNRVANSVEEAKKERYLARADVLYSRIQRANEALDKAVANYQAHLEKGPS